MSGSRRNVGQSGRSRTGAAGVPSAFAVLALVFAFTCTSPTRVTGMLVRKLGQPGDLRGARVALYERQDLTGSPVAEASSDSGSRADRSRFEFIEVSGGSYFLFAWQDVGRDGRVNDGDVVGVFGGEYRNRYGGEPFAVTEGKTVDLGEIQMSVLRESIRTAMGERVANGTATNFNYVCYHDLTLTSLAITFPGLGTYIDPLAPGLKVAGQTYYSLDWRTGGREMPTGRHRLVFRGLLDSRPFDVELEVDIE